MNAFDYNIDFNKFSTWLIPPRMRFSFFIEFIKCLVVPINQLYTSFKRYRDNITYRMIITPQVCYLEKLLNDSFDSVERRIYITDSLNYLVQLIHTDEAQIPLITHMDNQGPTFDEEIPIIHDDSAYADSGYDFNVVVPFNLSISQENRMKSLLNTYKLASKRFKILYI